MIGHRPHPTLYDAAIAVLLVVCAALPARADDVPSSVTILSPPLPAAYWRPQLIRIEGPFVRSVYHSFDRVLPDSLLSHREQSLMAWEVADIFRWEADFTRDLRPGDGFRIIFERLLSPDGEVRYGRLLAADMIVGGRHLHAYEYDDPDGRTVYYDEAGRSLRRAFLTVPVEFKRISSGFGVRFHPILKQWRNHQGIDYAAQSGTPVQSVGDGIVTRAGTAGGYGRMIEVRHANGAVTRYAHLRGYARGIRAGVRVAQGQVIGYVGKTGLATGPHLHFEFLLNGVPTDPRDLTTDEPDAARPADESGYLVQVTRLRRLLFREPAAQLASATPS